tara:strand:+ start:2950 stop:3156 length:207 start_codon:yes stop_codon:yes gene_type:complete
MKQTKEDFAKAKSDLGMTGVQLAKTLRMGKGADRTIRRYESGETPVPGPLSVAVEALLNGFRPEENND